LFHDPVRVLRADTRAEVAGVLSAADDALADGCYVAGMLTYEAGLAMADMPAHDLDGPLAWLGVYRDVQSVPRAHVETAFQSVPSRPSVRNARFDVSRDTYRDAIREIKSRIRNGDVYQINYTGPVRFALDAGDALPLYAQMRRRQPVPYGAWLQLGDRRILCASPELFVRRDGDRLVTRPMKGTIRRGMTLAEDRRLRDALAADPKSRAENLMIVDLLRNDLSICCRPGSVTVPSLFSTETYDTLTQMTSTVEGRLRPDIAFSDIMAALFPCGSVTGAPKRRAMQRIHELETGPRGVYCGAIGYAAPDDTACFNVAIRTVTLTHPDRGAPDGARSDSARSDSVHSDRARSDGVCSEGGRSENGARNNKNQRSETDASQGAELKGVMGTGSGVVWDSDPDAEYDECRLKARFLTAPPEVDERAFRLIETMKARDGDIPLWDRHRRRVLQSAAYFGWAVDPDRVDEAVRQASEASGDGEHVVRMTLGPDGEPEVEVKPMPPDMENWSLAIVTEPARPDDPFFYHKTTRRGAYTRALDEAKRAGCDEGVLVTPGGAVTEGARSNLIVDLGDRWVTPPVSDGLLGGVYRGHLLASKPSLREERVTVEDLRAAAAIYCCNAVRGLIPATLEADLRA
jgi:para-aminobenzoate synthetase/4-amino-4-deoxychorismate lyase